MTNKLTAESLVRLHRILDYCYAESNVLVAPDVMDALQETAGSQAPEDGSIPVAMRVEGRNHALCFGLPEGTVVVRCDGPLGRRVVSIDEIFSYGEVVKGVHKRNPTSVHFQDDGSAIIVNESIGKFPDHPKSKLVKTDQHFYQIMPIKP